MLKKVLFVLVVAFACVQMAQAASSLGFDVARTPEEIQQLAALSNDELAEHIGALSSEALAEQIEILSDGRHGTLLARILTAVVKAANFMDEGQRNSLLEALNGMGLPFSFANGSNGVTVTTTDDDMRGSGTGTPFVTGNDFPNPSALSAGAVR